MPSGVAGSLGLRRVRHFISRFGWRPRLGGGGTGRPGELQQCGRLRAVRLYDVDVHSIKKGMLSKKQWSVTGSTQPTTVPLDTLNRWVGWMVAAGAENAAANSTAGACKRPDRLLLRGEAVA